jgi:hypothetical protein
VPLVRGTGSRCRCSTRRRCAVARPAAPPAARQHVKSKLASSRPHGGIAYLDPSPRLDRGPFACRRPWKTLPNAVSSFGRHSQMPCRPLEDTPKCRVVFGRHPQMPCRLWKTPPGTLWKTPPGTLPRTTSCKRRDTSRVLVGIPPTKPRLALGLGAEGWDLRPLSCPRT